MAIETIEWYHPKHKLPIYTRIVPPEQNSYEVGDTYEIRIEDPKRAEEKGDKRPYNYTHEAILIGVWSLTVSEIPGMLLALDANTSSRQEALNRTVPGSEPYPEDREMAVLTFLRKDAAKEFVLNEEESIPDKFNKEVTES
jgi:hypothetical protein